MKPTYESKLSQIRDKPRNPTQHIQPKEPQRESIGHQPSGELEQPEVDPCRESNPSEPWYVEPPPQFPHTAVRESTLFPPTGPEEAEIDYSLAGCVGYVGEVYCAGYWDGDY